MLKVARRQQRPVARRGMEAQVVVEIARQITEAFPSRSHSWRSASIGFSCAAGFVRLTCAGPKDGCMSEAFSRILKRQGADANGVAFNSDRRV
jgi:hypothetical protein